MAPRRSVRPRAALPFRQLYAAAPPVWHKVMHACESCSLRRAHAALAAASDDECKELEKEGSWSIITPAIRAVGARGDRAAQRAEAELLEYVEMCVRRGVSLDTSCPMVMAWEITSPPLVSAASYGLIGTVAKLLEAGADAQARDSDGNTALHVGIEYPEALRWMIDSGKFVACLNVRNHCNRSPFMIALVHNPWKPKYQQSAALLGPHSRLTDYDYGSARGSSLQSHNRVGLVRQRLHRIIQTGTGKNRGDPKFWSTAWHWSFPTSDRYALRITYELAMRGNTPLSPELWLHIFSFVQRDWFAVGLHDACEVRLG